jgi:hypothetical protein
MEIRARGVMAFVQEEDIERQILDGISRVAVVGYRCEYQAVHTYRGP